MKVDIGFWNQQGEYIQDIQEVNEMDMDKYFDELNDMANFKGFGETEETEEKEIIIDGVDVTGCEIYQIEANELYPKAQYCGSMRNTFCENEPNCYYKQLKRLEQKNAELKAYKDVNEDFKTAWEELKAENERLKAELTELEEKFLTLNGKSYSYYLTLQEIKDYLNTLSGIDNDFVNTETYLRILDLITKAEEE